MELILKSQAFAIVTKMREFLTRGETVSSDCGQYFVGTVRKGCVRRYYMEERVSDAPETSQDAPEAPPKPVRVLGTLADLKTALQPGTEIRLGVSSEKDRMSAYGISRPRRSFEANRDHARKKSAAQQKMEADDVASWSEASRAVATGYGFDPVGASRKARRKFYRKIPTVLWDISHNLRKPLDNLTVEEITIEAEWHKWRTSATRDLILKFARVNGRPPHRFCGVAGLEALKKLERISAPVVRMSRSQQIAAGMM